MLSYPREHNALTEEVGLINAIGAHHFSEIIKIKVLATLATQVLW